MMKTRAKNPSFKKWQRSQVVFWWEYPVCDVYKIVYDIYHNYFYHNTKALTFLFNSNYASTQAFLTIPSVKRQIKFVFLCRL